VLFNNADGNYEASYKPNVLLYADVEPDQPNIHWIPPAIYKSSCTIDVRYFPFDEQLCEMRFGSWTFDAQQVRIQREKPMVNLEDYLPSGTWDVISAPGVETYSKETNRMELVYHFRIRRKTLFYTVNLIIPTVLISFLSIFVFYLPTDEGEKMTLCISILLALVVFLLLVSKILPPTSMVIPLISKYLIFTLMMNIVTILNTVIIINWNYRTPRTHNMPQWVKVIFISFLPRVLFMRRPEPPEKDHSYDECASLEGGGGEETGSICSGGDAGANLVSGGAPGPSGKCGELVVANDEDHHHHHHPHHHHHHQRPRNNPSQYQDDEDDSHDETNNNNRSFKSRRAMFKKNFSLELVENLNAEADSRNINNVNNSGRQNQTTGSRRGLVRLHGVGDKAAVGNNPNRMSQASYGSANLNNAETNLDFGAMSSQNSTLQRDGKQSELFYYIIRFFFFL
jgi:hypothetical protein